MSSEGKKKTKIIEMEKLTKMMNNVDICCVTEQKNTEFLYCWKVQNLKELFLINNEMRLSSLKFMIDKQNQISGNLIMSTKYSKIIESDKNDPNDSISNSHYLLYLEKRYENHFIFALKINNPLLINAKMYAELTIVNKKLERLECDESKFILSNNVKYNIISLLDIGKLKLTDQPTFTCYCKIRLEGFTNIVRNNQVKFLINFREDFKTLFKSKMFFDFVLIVQGEQFFIHIAVLSSRSPIFKSLFEKIKNLGKSNNYITKHNNPKAFHEMLRYIYYGEVQHLSDVCYELYVLAEYYKLEDLKEVCISFMKDNISLQNIHEVISFVKNHEILVLKIEVVAFLKKNINEFIKTTTLDSVKASNPDFIKWIILLT